MPYSSNVTHPSQDPETLGQPPSIRHHEIRLSPRSSVRDRIALFTQVSVDLLRSGFSIRFVATGESMEPTIHDGEAITVEPILPFQIKRGDIILYEMPNRVIAHRVVRIIKSVPILSRLAFCNSDRDAIGSSINEYSIPSFEFILLGDAYETCDRTVKVHQILGKVVSLERQGQRIGLDRPRTRFFQNLVLFRYFLMRAIAPSGAGKNGMTFEDERKWPTLRIL